MVRFESGEHPERESWLTRRLEDDNSAASPVMAKLRGTPHDDETPLHVYALDESGELVGGLTGYTWITWLHVELLWVDPAHRGVRLGARLMELAEEQARDRGCGNSRVETWSFQAPGFYRGLGYSVIGEIPDYPPGVTDYILVKRLD